MKISKLKINLHTITSWGASVVIIGAMAKLLHWHSADLLIITGMSAEAFLFFILGFQHEEDNEAETASLTPTVVHQHVPSGVQAPVVPVATSPVVQQQPTGGPAFSMTGHADSEIEFKKLAGNLEKLNISYESMLTTFKNFENSAQQAGQMHIQMEQMAKNMAALNTVYANMLTALQRPHA